jgi:UDP-N-acetylmuramoyl-tripeptide--D-alanyl-D-alanine ligase
MMTIAEFYASWFRGGNVSTDSRNIKSGDIFIALKGDNFDGNEYAEKAILSGASVAVVEKSISIKHPKFFKVWDTLNFLQELANFHRRKSEAHIIGLTGTNGKTTTKELLFHILSQKFKVRATEGNLNNHIGVPLTLLSLKDDTEIAIIEMGANHPGEIKSLCEIAEPDSGLITNIGRAHLEGFGSFEGVRNTKAELYNFLKDRKGKIYYNDNDTTLTGLLGEYSPSLSYNSGQSICRGELIQSVPTLKIKLSGPNNSAVSIDSGLFGDYNMINILAAACVGIDFGINLSTIKKGVESYKPSNLRSQILNLSSLMLIMDCYNANPTSMNLALQDFDRLKHPKKMLILGGMKELGNYSEEEHVRIGKLINDLQVTRVILTGNEFKNIPVKNSVFCPDNMEIIEQLKKEDLTGCAILIKGSRANHLEKVCEFIKTRFP